MKVVLTIQTASNGLVVRPRVMQDRGAPQKPDGVVVMAIQLADHLIAVCPNGVVGLYIRIALAHCTVHRVSQLHHAYLDPCNSLHQFIGAKFYQAHSFQRIDCIVEGSLFVMKQEFQITEIVRVLFAHHRMELQKLSCRAIDHGANCIVGAFDCTAFRLFSEACLRLNLSACDQPSKQDGSYGSDCLNPASALGAAETRYEHARLQNFVVHSLSPSSGRILPEAA